MKIEVGTKLLIITPGNVRDATVTYIDDGDIVLDKGQVIIRKFDGVDGRSVTLMENGRGLPASEIAAQPGFNGE